MNELAPTKTYRKVKPISGWRGDVALYKVNPPLPYEIIGGGTATTEYVLVSAVDLDTYISIGSSPPTCETYMFPATADGKAIDMLEMEGSYKGDKDHAQVFSNIGYVPEI